MSDFNYSSVLTRCMIISAIGLFVGVGFPAIPPIVSFMAALIPLIWYHTMYLRPRAAEGLPQPAIDSVYYYGFLITVGALGATALNLSLHGIGEDFTGVAAQFGLGLLATGYAVWARVHLTASTKLLDEEELRSIMSRQIVASRELLDNIELASASFETYATKLLKSSGDFAADTEARTQATIDAAIKAFAGGIAAMSEQGQIALTDLRGVINDVTFGSEREALRNSVTAMVETVTDLGKSLDRLKASSSAGAASVGEFAGKLEQVNSTAGAAAGRLAHLGQEDGPVERFGAALRGSGERAVTFVAAARDASAALSSFGEAGISGKEAMDAIGRKASLAASKFDTLGEALDNVAASGEGVNQATARIAALREAASAGTSSLAEFEGRITAVVATAGNLGNAFDQASNDLNASATEGARTIDAAAQKLAASVDSARSRIDAAMAAVGDGEGHQGA